MKSGNVVFAFVGAIDGFLVFLNGLILIDGTGEGGATIGLLLEGDLVGNTEDITLGPEVGSFDTTVIDGIVDGAFVGITDGFETGDLVGLNAQRSYVSDQPDVNTTLLLSSQ